MYKQSTSMSNSSKMSSYNLTNLSSSKKIANGVSDTNEDTAHVSKNWRMRSSTTKLPRLYCEHPFSLMQKETKLSKPNINEAAMHLALGPRLNHLDSVKALSCQCRTSALTIRRMMSGSDECLLATHNMPSMYLSSKSTNSSAQEGMTPNTRHNCSCCDRSKPQSSNFTLVEAHSQTLPASKSKPDRTEMNTLNNCFLNWLSSTSGESALFKALWQSWSQHALPVHHDKRSRSRPSPGIMAADACTTACWCRWPNNLNCAENMPLSHTPWLKFRPLMPSSQGKDMSPLMPAMCALAVLSAIRLGGAKQTEASPDNDDTHTLCTRNSLDFWPPLMITSSSRSSPHW